jgi:hypothetical protein
MVVSTLLYGYKAWTVQRRHVSRVQACEMMSLRRKAGATRLNRMRSEDTHKSLGQVGVVDLMKEKQKTMEEEVG